MLQHAFEGINVVELGGYIVGSLCTAFLAELGANVIKFESQQGDGLRPQLGSFQGWNRGKRGVVVDLRTDEGRTILHKLVRRSDVLVQNLRLGIAERWGADYETLSKINPRLVYCAMPGYGQSGPDIAMPAFDPLLQARSGAMAGQGGPGQPPVYYRVPISDNAGATLGAYAVALALYHRARTGKGQFVHGALLNSTVAMQSGEFVSYSGKPEEPRMGNMGVDATYRMYQARDSWIFIACKDEISWSALCKVVEREDIINDPRFTSLDLRRQNAEELAAILEPVFRRRSSKHWLDMLEKTGILCSPVNYSRDLFEDPHILANDLVSEYDSVDLGKLKQRGIVIKLSKTPVIAERPAPGLGQHTEEVIAELGYTREQIQEMTERRIIVQREMNTDQ